VAPERIVLTASTSEAYSYLFKLLADPGDHLLVPRPSYPLFDFLGGLEGLRIGRYPLRYTGTRWEVDVDRLAAAIDPRTRAILVVSPNNPTGSFLSSRDRRMIEELAAECGLAIIADEVFRDYPLEPGTDRPPSCASGSTVLTFALSGLSKVLGAPQLKLSWLVVDGPPAQTREAMARLEILGDTYLSVGTQVQLALPELMDLRGAAQERILGRVKANLARLKEACGAHGDAVEGLRVEGGWYAVLRVRGDEETLSLSLLERAGVLVHPGYFYDFPTHGHLVLSLLPAAFSEGLERLFEHLSEA